MRNSCNAINDFLHAEERHQARLEARTANFLAAAFAGFRPSCKATQQSRSHCYLLFPEDGIIDSKSESFTYLSSELTSGEHVIAFRIYDQNDNAGLAKLIVRIP